MVVCKAVKNKELLKRYLLFIAGLFVGSVGICLIIKAELGSSPISSLPYALSLKYPVTLGTFVLALNVVLIILQKCIRGREFKRREWLQLPVSFLFAVFVDLSMAMLAPIEPHLYLHKLCVLLVGCAVLGLGVSMEVVADVVMLSGEAFVHAVSQKVRKEFGVVKIIFDTTLMVLTCIASLLLFGRVVGVREGTVVAAFAVGLFARFFNGRLAFLDDMLKGESNDAKPARTDYNVVVTIAREYGSGGRMIGRRVAERLGFAFYDRAIIDMVAKEKGLGVDYVEKREQNIQSNLLYDLVMQDFTSPMDKSLSADDSLFTAQSDVIRKIASYGPCVIVGRCADYVLRDNPRCLKVFIHADLQDKLCRAVEQYGDRKADAQSKTDYVDRGRANHYKTYTGQTWGDARNYDLSLNSSAIGLDACCGILVAAVSRMSHAGQ